MNKIFYKDVKVKEMVANPAIQNVLKEFVEFPKKVLIKEVKAPYKNDANETTQKVHAIAGKTLTDVVELDLVLYECSVDAEHSINKLYEILDYKFALQANMTKGNFVGYAPTGIKIIVTRIEEVKAGDK